MGGIACSCVMKYHMNIQSSEAQRLIHGGHCVDSLLELSFYRDLGMSAIVVIVVSEGWMAVRKNT